MGHLKAAWCVLKTTNQGAIPSNGFRSEMERSSEAPRLSPSSSSWPIGPSGSLDSSIIAFSWRRNWRGGRGVGEGH